MCHSILGLGAWVGSSVCYVMTALFSVVPDMDGDGDVDVLSTSASDNAVVLYTNSGARPPVWTRRVISTTAQGASSVFAIDLDR